MTTELSTRAATNGHHATPPSARGIIASLDDVFRLADVLVRSRMLPSSITTPEAATAIILKGQELGIPAMEAFAGITVIQGKPTVSPQLMLSLIYRSGQLADMQVEDDGAACKVTMKRSGRAAHSESFSMADAASMQLAGKDNWKKMPKVMRKWRAISACARVVFPDVIAGIYTHEELGGAIDEEGEFVHDVQVTAQEQLPGPAVHDNASGHGRGSYASPEQEKKYREKVEKFIDAFNGRFLDKWTGRDGAVVDGIKEPINWFSAACHMIRWACETHVGDLDESIVPTDLQARQRDSYNALVFARERKAFEAELASYAKGKAHRVAVAWRKKNPDARPECLGFEELMEALADEATAVLDGEELTPEDLDELAEPGSDG